MPDPGYTAEIRPSHLEPSYETLPRCPIMSPRHPRETAGASDRDCRCPVGSPWAPGVLREGGPGLAADPPSPISQITRPCHGALALPARHRPRILPPTPAISPDHDVASISLVLAGETMPALPWHPRARCSSVGCPAGSPRARSSPAGCPAGDPRAYMAGSVAGSVELGGFRGDSGPGGTPPGIVFPGGVPDETPPGTDLPGEVPGGTPPGVDLPGGLPGGTPRALTSPARCPAGPPRASTSPAGCPAGPPGR